ncbi:hypothetical protein L484_025391 [Morus notabilis]|uniref:BHLH domain-containing protein n=1 Tax=Morus notabilis TaxID=981085 RepID=W9R2F8_9ROSA|nr:hypothetical protein L484_025391 [Morus notabilis]
MRNPAILPFVSPNYEFGNINYELQTWNENLHNMSSGFCLEPKFLDNHENQQRVENYSFPSFQSSLVTYQPVFPSSVFSSCDLDNTSHHQSMLLGKKILASQLDMAIRNARKRPIEVNNDIFAKSGISELLSDRTTLNEWGKNKRSKVTGNNQQWQHQVMRETLTGMHEHKVQELPVRRSQKLTDKITALQKLVSPYGKTDTASVLQEASLYIKLLQEQIQNLFRMLSSSYDSSVRSLPHSQKVTIDQERIDHKYQRY